jgi:hypothetical protein
MGETWPGQVTCPGGGLRITAETTFALQTCCIGTHIGVGDDNTLYIFEIFTTFDNQLGTSSSVLPFHPLEL